MFSIDLMADPTKCRVTKDASEFMKLKDIAHQITFTIFGHGCDQLFIAFYNVDVGAIYYACKRGFFILKLIVKTRAT